MESGEWRRVTYPFDQKIKELEDEVRKVWTQRRDTLKQLEEQCVIEHGSHEDNKAFMIGSCTRCGYCFSYR